MSCPDRRSVSPPHDDQQHWLSSELLQRLYFVSSAVWPLVEHGRGVGCVKKAPLRTTAKQEKEVEQGTQVVRVTKCMSFHPIMIFTYIIQINQIWFHLRSHLEHWHWQFDTHEDNFQLPAIKGKPWDKRPPRSKRCPVHPGLSRGLELWWGSGMSGNSCSVSIPSFLSFPLIVHFDHSIKWYKKKKPNAHNECRSVSRTIVPERSSAKPKPWNWRHLQGSWDLTFPGMGD